MDIYTKIKKIISSQNILYQFIRNNKKVFPQKHFQSDKKILIELFEYKPSYLAFSYYGKVLKEKHNANLFFYKVKKENFIKKILHSVKSIFFISEYDLAKSFGCENIIIPNSSKSDKHEKIKKKILNIIKTKKDILDIKINNVLVGDLFYDEYLNHTNLPTIDINNKNFEKFLLSSIDLFFYWDKLIDPNLVKSVVISHATYFKGLPGRIAITKKIPCYNVSNNFGYYLNKKYSKRISHLPEFPKIFKKIPKKISYDYIKKAKKIVLENFIGKSYSIKISSLKKRKKNNSKLQILIASHCFTDAVHIHGNNIFIDYFDWIHFLGKISNKTNYDWFVKIHPNEYEKNVDKMLGIIKHYPKLNLLPKNTKNIDLLEKTDYVLTVYGSVGREYPLFNIPVINASDNGPHQAYKFCHNVSTINEYKKSILNINRIKVRKKELKKVFEFYSLRYFLDFYFFGLNNALKMNKLITSNKIDQYDLFNYWLKNFNIKKHNKYLKIIRKFIDSKQHHFSVNNLSKKRNFLKL